MVLAVGFQLTVSQPQDVSCADFRGIRSESSHGIECHITGNRLTGFPCMDSEPKRSIFDCLLLGVFPLVSHAYPFFFPCFLLIELSYHSLT